MIYCDWNATSPLRPVARAAWLAAQDQAWANPGSIHSLGQQARHVLDEAKRTLARLLAVKASELVLTSGGTEANALAIAQAHGPVAVSTVEHSSILRAVAQADKQADKLAVDAHGQIQLDDLAADTALVACQFANNETGIRQDLPRLCQAIRQRAPQARILVDACQGTGKAELDIASLGADLVSIAGHKFGAPKGCGLLWVRNGVRLEPLLRGGRQQQDRRSGTEDPALAAAMAAALNEAVADHPHQDQRQRQLLEDCFAQIRHALPAAAWIGHGAPRLANTLSLGHPGLHNEILVQRLDLRGIAVSVGAACMAGRGEPSHVIAALGVAPELARSVIRISIGWQTTATDLATVADTYIAEARALLA
jgi:cysteine desulfurase